MHKQAAAFPLKVVVVIVLIVIVLVIILLFTTETFKEVFNTITNYLGLARSGLEETLPTLP